MSEQTKPSSALVSDQLSSASHSSIHAGQSIHSGGGQGLSGTMGSQTTPINQVFSKGIDCFSSANIDSVTTGLLGGGALSQDIFGFFDQNMNPFGISHQGGDFNMIGDNLGLEQLNNKNYFVNAGEGVAGIEAPFSQQGNTR